jgi:hypothetical protein
VSVNRIGDAVRLSRDRTKDSKPFLHTQKTGVPVYGPVPDFVLQGIRAFVPVNGEYLFWSGESDRNGIVRT